ncbi:hypothetical protein PIB30_077905 [Stylosanthes scabra]|uniref:Uncharacterized protein n=1 Tax=Stylosanthes scabra TaxID=79078 RepID=A0ABU6RR51_9FABA|nr:hypothetical protein [Stylosanthes scabra]
MRLVAGWRRWSGAASGRAGSCCLLRIFFDRCLLWCIRWSSFGVFFNLFWLRVTTMWNDFLFLSFLKEGTTDGGDILWDRLRKERALTFEVPSPALFGIGQFLGGWCSKSFHDSQQSDKCIGSSSNPQEWVIVPNEERGLTNTFLPIL